MERSPIILLLEDNELIQQTVTHMLGLLEHPSELIIAGTIAAASEVISKETPDLFILDCGLPDGDGIDFLCDMITVNPEARAIVFTAEPTAERRMRAEQLGILRFLQKPVSTGDFLEAVRLHLTQPESEDEFRATLSGLTPMDIIQLKCLSGSCGALRFTREGGSGCVWFENGQLTHAMVTTGLASVITGQAALNEIGRWTNGRAEDASDMAVPSVRTLEKDWQALLMEAAQANDERAAE